MTKPANAGLFITKKAHLSMGPVKAWRQLIELEYISRQMELERFYIICQLDPADQVRVFI